MSHTISGTAFPAGTRHWRAGLSVLVGFVILYAAAWLVRLVMGVGPNLLLRWLGATPDVRAYAGSTLNYGVGILSCIIFPALALKRVVGMDPWPVFFPLRKAWWKDPLFGCALVTSVLALIFFCERQAGWLILEGWNWQRLGPDAWLRTAWVGLLVNTGVAIGEETIFRGYLLTGLRAAWGKWTGILVMMVIFGFFHLPAYFSAGFQSWSLALAILLATLFGAVFGFTYLRSGSLWLPVGLHFAWNFIENDVLNLSADSTNPNLVGALTRLQGPLSATGMGLGNVVIIETLALALIAAGLWLWLRNRPEPDGPLSV